MSAARRRAAPDRHRRIVGAAITVALLAATALLTAARPDDLTRSFEVDGAVGETVTTRELVVTVDEVRATRSVRTADGGFDTDALFIVADATVASRIGPRLLSSTRLLVGDTVYLPSTLAALRSLADQTTIADVPLRGALVWEVPADVLAADGADDARIVVQQSADVRLDTVAVIGVDLTALEPERTVRIEPAAVPEAAS